MPPKKEPKVSKADLAKKQKVVEDKTFGLKNKNKSKAVQQYVKNLQQSAQPNRKAAEDPKAALKKKKEEEAAREKELNEIFKVAISQPKVPVGVDPKSIVCEFYRRGQCTKGFKCKFSHDLSVERKGEKIDLYSDQRDGSDEEDKMEDWDQETLEKVVETLGKEYKNANKPTEIVCKYFLDAVERKQYGWFWVCPNGGKDCQYRHALPPGYVLKSQMKALLEEESANKLSIEEQIEQDRHGTKSSTPITPELFMEWKKKKQEAKEAEQAAKRAARAREDRLSGRELFASDASLFVDDAEAEEAYDRVEEEEQKPQDSAAAPQSNPGQQEPRPASESKDGQSSGYVLSAEDEQLLVEDDDEVDEGELLDELEESLMKSSISSNGNAATDEPAPH